MAVEVSDVSHYRSPSSSNVRINNTPPLGSHGLQYLSHSLHRYRFRLALITSLAAAWIHSSTVKSKKKIGASPTASTSFAAVLTDGDNHFQTATRFTSSRRLASNRGTHRVRSNQARNHSTISSSSSTSASSTSSESSNDSDSSSIASSITSIDTSEPAQNETNANIVELMRHPDLLTDIKKPKYPIVLCHGLYGFDVRGPFWGLEIHYWASVLDILRKRVGAEVIVRGVPGTGAIADRALELHNFLRSSESGIRGKHINFVGHSMGGLDARHIISVIKPNPEDYTPVSLTSVSTPHRGSPFMDWCNANVGTGNDRVEAEIKEAKKRLGDDGGATTKGMQDASQAAKEENKKIPYSLKTPLFVRPSKAKSAPQQSEGILDTDELADSLQNAGKEAVTKIASLGATPSPSTQVGEGQDLETTDTANSSVKKGSEKKKDSILNFSAFNKALASIGGSFSSYMLGVLDQPAYAMLSTRYMSQVFNPSVPDSPNVAYFSVAARKRSLAIWHPLWLPKLVLDAAAESRSAGGERDGSGDALGSELQGNDGLVSVESAKWGKFLGVIDGCDHWDLRGGGAPRWRGRVNPATGKPWPEDVKEEKKKEEKKETSWIDVNTILGKLLNRKEEGAVKKEKKEVDTAEEKRKNELRRASDEKAKGEDDGLLDEVASWISDRLPQGDETRRAEAERVADEHDRKAKEKYKQASQSERLVIDEENRVEGKRNDAEVKVEMTNKTNKLRRDAAWQEELGHEDAARELRRELAWHRAEWDRYTISREENASASVKFPRPYPHQRELDWDRHNKSKQDKLTQDEKEKKKKLEEANELERFWIAICRHLWSHGL